MTEEEAKIFNMIKQLTKKYPLFYKIIKIIIIIVTLIPVVIWISYRIGSCYVIIPTDTSEGEFLSFYGTILSFVSTLGLGALALWQNIKANRINNRLSLIEQKRFKLELQPFVVVTGWSLEEKNKESINENAGIVYCNIIKMKKKDPQCAFLGLEFTNTSNTYIMMKCSGVDIYFYRDNCLEGFPIEKLQVAYDDLYDNTLYLENGQRGKMIFYLPIDEISTINKRKLRLEFTLKNRFNDMYKEIIIIKIVNIYTFQGTDKWSIDIEPRAHKIKKFNSETKKYEDD